MFLLFGAEDDTCRILIYYQPYGSRFLVGVGFRVPHVNLKMILEIVWVPLLHVGVSRN